MYPIVWKSFKGNIQNFLAFFISAMVSISSVYVILYMGKVSKNIPRQGLLGEFGSNDLEQLAQVTVPVLILISAVVTVYALQFYIRSRIKEYAMFTMLGIRKKDMRKMLVAEYAVACICSCFFGILGGRVITAFLEVWIEHRIGDINMSVDTISLYKWSIVVCIVLIGIILFGISILLSEKDITELIKINVVKEKPFHGRYSILCFLVGIGMILVSLTLTMKWSGNASEIEQISFFILSVGMLLSINFGIGLFQRNREKKKTYYKNLLSEDQFYHRVRTNYFMISVQAALSVILLLFTFRVVSAIYTVENGVYPNDFLCLYDSEEKFVEQFAKKYGQEQQDTPIVWITGRQAPTMIGIPVSSYNRICNQNEVLKEDEIITLSHNGYSLIENEKTKDSVKIKFAKQSMSEMEEKKYHVKREEQRNLFEFSLDIEGVVVLSDEEFLKAREAEKEYQSIAILNVDEKDLAEATAYIQKEKKLERVFCKTIEKKNDQTEILLAVIMIGVLNVTLLFFGLFIMWLRTYGEFERLEQKYRFLNTLGMPKRILQNTLKQELRLPIKMQLIFTIFLSVLCGGVQAVAKVAHQGNTDFFFFYIKEMAIILAVYILIETIFLLHIQRWGIKNVSLDVRRKME